MDIQYTNLAHEAAAHMSAQKRGYYHVWTESGIMSGAGGTVDGRAMLTFDDGWTAALEGVPRGELEEAMQRHDRLQRAKVRAEFSDPVGVCPHYQFDRWGKISIPDLWERCPETFAGWMNFGDLVWSFGYCSLFYDWPLAMLTQYLRLDDPMMLCDGYAYLHRIFRRRRDREFARQLFTDITFYQIMCEVHGKARSPIGYHHQGEFFGFTPKLHAWSGRYAQIFLQGEAGL